MPLAAGATVVVRKLEYGTERVVASWSGTLMALTEDRAVVRAVFLPRSGQGPTVDGVPFRAGDVFTEYYFLEHWYNVFHIADAHGRPKGWYCNVTQPPMLDDEGIAFLDMALDVFVHPDGRCTVLDEDEFALASQRVYGPADIRNARSALADLLRIVADGALPAPTDGG